MDNAKLVADIERWMVVDGDVLVDDASVEVAAGLLYGGDQGETPHRTPVGVP